MRVVVIVKATQDAEAVKMPGAELIARMGAFNQSLIDAGVFVDAGGLKPSSKGAHVARSGEDRAVTKGPFGNVGRTRFGLLDLEGQKTSTRRSTGSGAVPIRRPGRPRSKYASSTNWRTSAETPPSRQTAALAELSDAVINLSSIRGPACHRRAGG
jgi:hypothetical protein